MKNGQILVVGLIGATALLATDHFPAPGETIRAKSLVFENGGKGYNQAIAAKRCGSRPVCYVTALGDDAFGEDIRAELAQGELDRYSIIRKEHSLTPFGVVTTRRDGENTVCVFRGACDAVTTDDILALEPEIEKSSVILLQMEMPEASVALLLQLARLHGVCSILNPAPAEQVSDLTLKRADYITPNWHEACTLADMPKNTDPKTVIANLHRRGAQKVILTMGGAGAIYSAADGEQFKLTAFPVQVVSSAGAGDTFNGVFASQCAEGVSVRAALRYASAAAAIAVSRSGVVASIPLAQEVQEFLHYSNPLN